MNIRAIAVLSILVCASRAHAVDVGSRIESVTVYPGGASITRVATVDLPAGDTAVRLVGLVNTIDIDALQIALGDDGLRMGQVKVGREQQREAYNAEVEKLRSEIDAMTRRIGEVDDSSNAARLRLKFLDGLAQGYAKEAWLEASRGSANVQSWQAALDLLQSGADDANRLIRDNDARKAELDKDLSLLNRRLTELRGGGLSSSAIELTLTAERASRSDIRFTYYQNDAGWSPRYEARLDSNGGELTMIQQAEVRQATGEAWDEVRLTLSTSAPTGELMAPELGSEFLDIYEPRPEMLMRGKSADMSLPASAPTAALEQVVVTGSRVRASIGDYAVNYELPGRQSISNRSDEAATVDLGQFTVKPDLVTRVVPRRSTQAFLAARFSYDRSLPLYEGPMGVFVDGVFAGNTQMPGAQPKEKVVLPLGQDRRVEVKVENQGGVGGTSGIIQKRKSEATDYVFEITNRRGSKSTVEVSDLYPVPRNDDIEVEVPNTATRPDERNIDDRPGVVLWKKTLAPGETWRIRHQYTISYPADAILNRGG